MPLLCTTPEIRVLDEALDEATIRALEAEIAGQLPTARAEGNTKHDHNQVCPVKDKWLGSFSFFS